MRSVRHLSDGRRPVQLRNADRRRRQVPAGNRQRRRRASAADERGRGRASAGRAVAGLLAVRRRAVSAGIVVVVVVVAADAADAGMLRQRLLLADRAVPLRRAAVRARRGHGERYRSHQRGSRVMSASTSSSPAAAASASVSRHVQVDDDQAQLAQNHVVRSASFYFVQSLYSNFCFTALARPLNT